jgi:hypothetical protein
MGLTEECYESVVAKIKEIHTISDDRVLLKTSHRDLLNLFFLDLSVSLNRGMNVEFDYPPFDPSKYEISFPFFEPKEENFLTVVFPYSWVGMR